MKGFILKMNCTKLFPEYRATSMFSNCSELKRVFISLTVGLRLILFLGVWKLSWQGLHFGPRAVFPPGTWHCSFRLFWSRDGRRSEAVSVA